MSDHMTKPLAELAALVLADGVIDEAEVTMIRERVYADGVIDREEADFLFQLNDAVSGKNNAPAWQALFVEAMTDYVLKDEKTPNVLDREEAEYLIKKIEADGTVDPAELELLVNITEKARECDPQFNTFVLDSLKKSIIADGVVDRREVDLMRRVIHGAGSGGGEGVDRAEAEMLFDINDATSGNEGHDPSWQTFFAETIGKHVLEDEVSPGVIDEAECDWLIARLERDGTYDENEKALLDYIKANAREITGKFKFIIEMHGGNA